MIAKKGARSLQGITSPKRCNLMEDNELDLRKKKVLGAVIRSYVRDMAPISSSLLLSEYGFQCSSATLRNIMAHLEAEGFLKQPHISAGRIPTDKGYRYYVDYIIEPKRISPEERDNIRQKYYSQPGENFEQLIEKTTHILSAITHQAALAMMPSINLSSFEKINFMRIYENRLLVVLLGSSGIVKNVVIALPRNISDEEIKKIENLLNSELKGISLNLLRDYLLDKINRCHDVAFNLARNALEIMELADIGGMDDRLFLEGLSLIIGKPEFKEADKSKGVLETLERKIDILEIMNEDLESVKNEIMVRIGAENTHQDIRNCSLITSKYRTGNKAIGTLGIIGPTRMPYEEIISVIDGVSDVLSDILTEISIEEEL